MQKSYRKNVTVTSQNNWPEFTRAPKLTEIIPNPTQKWANVEVSGHEEQPEFRDT